MVAWRARKDVETKQEVFAAVCFPVLTGLGIWLIIRKTRAEP